MEYRKLGRSGLKVSSVCLGAMTFGEPTEGSFMHGISATEDTAFAMLDRAVEAGVNFIDTANVYGNDGLSERVFGKWLAAKKNRDSLVVATKFRFRMSPDVNGTGASRYQIRQAVEGSLRRLGTDRIDLYQIDGDNRKLLKSVRANEEGRVTSNLLEGEALKVARYELVFHVSEYYKKLGVTQSNPEFLDVVPLRVAIWDDKQRYHVPLYFSPWGYMTYRGS
jgi:hydroxyisourate hydrolase